MASAARGQLHGSPLSVPCVPGSGMNRAGLPAPCVESLSWHARLPECVPHPRPGFSHFAMPFCNLI